MKSSKTTLKLNLRDAILYLILVFGLALLASCGATEPPRDTQKPTMKRAQVLENGSITYVFIRPSLDSVYKVGDSVWVNLRAHRIDDTDTTAMMCVLR